MIMSNQNQNLFLVDNTLYITGSALSVPEVSLNGFAKWTGTASMEAIITDGGLDASSNGVAIVHAIGTDANTYVAGNFATIGMSSTPYIAGYTDPGVYVDLSGFGATVSGEILQLAHDPSNSYLYAAGYTGPNPSYSITRIRRLYNNDLLSYYYDFSAIASGFSINAEPKMCLDSCMNLWLGYSTTLRKFTVGTSTWDNITGTTGTIRDIAPNYIDGKIYYAHGNNIAWIPYSTIDPPLNLLSYNLPASEPVSVKAMVDGSIVVGFTNPTSGTSNSNIQIYDGSAWNNVYQTNSTSGIKCLEVDSSGTIYALTGDGSLNIGEYPYADGCWNVYNYATTSRTISERVPYYLSIPDISTASTNVTVSFGQTLSLSVNTPTDRTNTGVVSRTYPLTGFNMTSSGPDNNVFGGSATGLDLSGTAYTLVASNVYGSSQPLYVTVRMVSDDTDALSLLGYSDTSIMDMYNVSIPGGDNEVNDFSGYIAANDTETNKRIKRRSLLNVVWANSDKIGLPYFVTTKGALKLGSNYTQDTIRVYRASDTVNLADVSGYAIYTPLYHNGDRFTFNNVGGSDTVEFSAKGAGTYDVSYNTSDYGTVNEGETVILGGVEFYIGSVGTEGTAGDQICFAGDAMVLLDRGEVKITDIKPGDQLMQPDGTLRSVTRLIRVFNTAGYILRVPKGSISHGVPNRLTSVTPEHTLYVDGDMIKAEQLIRKIKVVDNPPSFVYNIQSDDPEAVMIVNGIISETIDHNNINVHTRDPKRRINLTKGVVEEIN